MKKNGLSSFGPGDIGPLNSAMFSHIEQLQEVMQQRDKEILGELTDPKLVELAFQDFPEPEVPDAIEDLPVPEPEDAVEINVEKGKEPIGGVESVEQDVDSSEGEENVITEDELSDGEESNDQSSVNDLKVRADEKVRKGEWRAAIDLYTKALQIRRIATLYGNRSLCYMKIGEYDKAKDDCCSAIALDPYYKRIYRRRAAISLKNRDYYGAAEDLQSLLFLSFNSAPDDLVREEYRALLPLARWVKIHGSEPTVKFKRLEKDVLDKLSNTEQTAAKSQKRKQMWAQAVESWSMAMIVSPPSGWLFAERGLANFKLGKANLAEADVTEAILLEPSNPSHYRLRADIRKKLGNAKGSAADLTKSKELGSTTIYEPDSATTDEADLASDEPVASTSAPPRRLIEELPSPTKPTPTFKIPVHDVYSSSADELYNFQRLPDTIRSLIFRS